MTLSTQRQADKPRDGMTLTVRIGLFDYTIEMMDGESSTLGTAGIETQRIKLNRNLKSAKRWATCWGLLAQVWQIDLDPDRMFSSRNQEHIANLIGMGMACMDPATYLKLWAFVMHEQLIDDAAIFEPVQPAFDEPPMKLQAPA